MIDPRELRIGNLIQSKNGPIVVESIFDEKLNVQIDFIEWSDSHEFYDPIPLTIAWLDFFGFECAPHDPDVWAIKGIGDKGYAIVIHKYKYYWLLNQPASKQFRYVHEIQNLFHALTGLELRNKI